MNSWKRVLDILKEEMKNELREELINEFKLIAKEVIATELPLKNQRTVKEYMHLDDILSEFKISRKLFFECRKQNYFDGIRQGKFKVYHVKQFAESLRKHEGKKPSFIKSYVEV